MLSNPGPSVSQPMINSVDKAPFYERARTRISCIGSGAGVRKRRLQASAPMPSRTAYSACVWAVRASTALSCGPGGAA